MGVQFTYADYDYRFFCQHGRCAICRKSSKRRLHMDHDHKTKLVRGLLCGKCNKGLGLFNDTIDLLNRAIQYLIPSLSQE